MDKIISARDLFTVKVNFPEPNYYILKDNNCYNAVTNGRDNIGITETTLKEFTTEELAGIIAHEFSHIEAVRLNRQVEHWEVDVMGAGLTSKDIMLKQLEKMSQRIRLQSKRYRFIMYSMPLSFLVYRTFRNDWENRIEMVKRFAK